MRHDVYSVTNGCPVYSGAMLMNAGLNLTRDVYEDGTSVTKHFKAVK